MINRIEKINCTGCKMCADICPQGAVSYEADAKGFWYPVVDENKCIRCGLCIKTCPCLSGYISDKHEPVVYSAWLKNDDMRLKSTSGGIYYTLAERIIRKGGCIVGCRYTDDYKGAYHVISDSNDDLDKIIGTKYFQSDTVGIYIAIKRLLDEGKDVLFCGTPCQSAGLQKFLMKPCPHLVTVDFVCRGINSPQIYRDYLSELEAEYQSKVEWVHMKDKKAGWQSLGFFVKFQSGEEYFRSGEDELWVQGYTRDNLYTRPACHCCRFRTFPRVSDISLGDFWGISGARKEDLFKGISLVMINSDKGQALFNQVQDEIVFERRSVEEAVDGNPSILQNESVSRNSDVFFQQLECMSVSESIRKCLSDKWEESEASKPVSWMKKLLGKLNSKRL